MKAFLSAARRFFAEIWSDAMLAMLVLVPVLMGLAFRFGVPSLEAYLCDRLNAAAFFAPYYVIFDLLLSIMTPIMFTAAGAMVILDEADMGLSRAISVTPVGRSGYLLSRVGAPALLATVYCAAATLVFRLSEIDTARLMLLAMCSGALSVGVALMIASLAKNKVEGMALSKMSGLLMIGLPVALLVSAPYKYACAILPSFWMTELALGGSLWLALPALISAALWAAVFAGRFMKKLLT